MGERDLRMQEQQQREAVISRRRRRKLLERKQRFERSRTMAMAASSEDEHFQRRRQHLRDQRRPLSYGNGNQDIDDDDYQINVVRGRDGSLYYAKTPVNRQRQERQERIPTIAEESDSEYSSSDSIQSDVEEDDIADAIRRMRPCLVPLARENHPSR